MVRTVFPRRVRPRLGVAALAMLALAGAACGQHAGVHPEPLVLDQAASSETFDPSGDGGFDVTLDEGETRSFDAGGKGSGKGGRKGSGKGGGGAGSSGGADVGAGGADGGLPLATREVSLAGPPTSGNVGTLVDVNGDRIPDRGTVLIAITGDGPLYTCPVYGRGHYSSSFGAYRPGPPVHPHAGNDIVSDFGAPILAPFDGTAVPVQSGLGGLGVKVYGADGYVYNAHLAGYGKLGPVKTGDIIGFVGQTGNARYTVPHNHFEWHPGNGPAVDPFPFLNEVCAA